MKKLLLLSIVIYIGIISVFADPSNQKNIAADTIFANITPVQANDTINEHANDPWFVILDVRTLSEYAVKHLAEGVVIDFYSASFAATLATLNKSKTYVLHCASGGRSGQVYTMMQNLHFSKVYNMTGGINAWVSAGLPVTTSEAPVTGILCDTIFSFNNIPISQTDSIQLTITNAANSILVFDSISGISGTDFNTNFDTGISVLGARDYSFYIYYNPSDTIADSTIFSITSNGGIMNFYLYGTAYNPTVINKHSLKSFSFFNDYINQIIIINNFNNYFTQVEIYDINGKIMFDTQQSNSFVSIDYSDWKSSLYIFKITENKNSKTFKIPLIH